MLEDPGEDFLLTSVNLGKSGEDRNVEDRGYRSI